MPEKEFTPRHPDYSGSGIAIWKGTDKNGEVYLRVSVLGGKAVNCFKVKEKPKTETKEAEI